MLILTDIWLPYLLTCPGAHAAGPSDEDGLAAELRTGLLWDECRKLAAGGWVVDTAGYCTAFRVTLKVRTCPSSSAATHGFPVQLC